MRRIALAGAAVVFSSGLAVSADLDAPPSAYPAPPHSPVSHGWTGCYVGGNLGFGWTRDHSFDGALDTGSDTGTGVVGGGQVGCDYQIDNWVVGIQGMFDGTGVAGNHAYTGVPTDALGFNARWFGTLTGRLGYAVQPQTLLYVKGGAAWLGANYTDVDPSGSIYPPYTGSGNATLGGWTVGGGIEYALKDHWSVFTEYDFADLGSHNVSLSYDCGTRCGFANPYTYREVLSLQTVVVGINRRF
jgi:outer membrane immunogenic protein